MSTSVTATGSSTIQDLAKTIMQEFDVNQDNQFSYDEFANFLDSLVETVTGQKAKSTSGGSTSSASGVSTLATSLFLDSSSSATTGTSSYRDRMLGFDFSRMESAKGTLKYDAANLMQFIDPASPGAMKKVYAELVKMHPGAVSLDEQENLMLDGTGDGYIGVRPLDRSEDWANAPSGYCWQWMWYNEAHPGPNGETGQ